MAEGSALKAMVAFFTIWRMDIDEDDIRALTPSLAARVLRRNFWDVFPLDNVQPLCAMVIYDTAVNMGVFYARKMAQQALGLPHAAALLRYAQAGAGAPTLTGAART